MGLPNLHNQDMSLVLSTDAKPRLKWTPELHHRFVEAVANLGGPDKATPKALMRVMGVPGLTLYHLKSHLQKFRLGKSQQAETFSGNNQEDYSENQDRDIQFDMESSDGNKNPVNESLQIAQALQLQLEVQRKLHEQIEVQRHLQLRIEAQGKYLQSVLKKAQETLAGYNSSSVGVEVAKAELSQLVSMVDSGCPSSSLSGLTEIGGSTLMEKQRNAMRATGCSSLTSSESSGRKEDRQPKNENGDTNNSTSMEIHPGDTQASGRKRCGSTISDGNCEEQPSGKRSPAHTANSGDRLRRSGLPETLDLNTQYQIDIDSGPKPIDLNCKE